MKAYRVALLISLLLAGVNVSAAQTLESTLHWRVKFLDVDDLERPLTYRIYGEPEELRLQLTIYNESPNPVVLVADAFRKAFGLGLRGHGESPIAVEWSGEFHRSGDQVPWPVVGTDSIDIAPQQGLRWGLTVRKADARPFAAGAYAVDVVARDAVATLHTSNGDRWIGRFLPDTSLTLEVRPPANAFERGRLYVVAGRAALEAEDLETAVQEYTRALQANPTELEARANLGHIYLRTNRFGEAIQMYEQVLPGLRPDSPLHMLLAMAYVGANDEANAANTLRQGGLPADRIPAELNNLKARLRQRGR